MKIPEEVTDDIMIDAREFADTLGLKEDRPWSEGGRHIFAISDIVAHSIIDEAEIALQEFQKNEKTQRIHKAQ